MMQMESGCVQRLREMGCEILQYETAGDDRDKIADKISEVLKEADLILTTGGVSVGGQGSRSRWS